jgi:hypothetical protein
MRKKQGGSDMKKLTIFFSFLAVIASIFVYGGQASANASGPNRGIAVLRWIAVPQCDGLKAFEGVEDDRDHSEPGVTHIFVQGDTYRFNMDTKQVEAPGDRQRNEVKGMVMNGQPQIINLGSTWRFDYSMFIPPTLKGTTSFTHIMQMKQPNTSTAPLMTMDLRRVGDQEIIALKAWLSGVDVASTDLAPLRGHWIDTEVTVTAGEGTAGKLHWKLIDRGRVIVDAERDGVNLWLGDRLWPKWGIYRSINDKADVLDTYLLLKNMRAYQIL